MGFFKHKRPQPVFSNKKYWRADSQPTACTAEQRLKISHQAIFNKKNMYDNIELMKPVLEVDKGYSTTEVKDPSKQHSSNS